ncbi:MAG: sigma-70 family RNA polymerase sigma factor [Flavobacteriales bacterium]|nr:sigma-70 family RNA polymerase sigma factor [Flavobacteriales bacterium]MCX7768428.1 sigma-70 family RNA polymerase sigma factor [Flavobacteriales bacterium]MDW8409679.1 sigma-70 family RNA polymerase sigma factor [Flavobacteriales bacterium]
MHSDGYSFTEEVIRQASHLRYFALSLTKNEADSEDLVQETMMKAFIYRTRFTEHTNMKAWLFTIMKNIFINDYRRKIRAKTMLDNTQNGFYLNYPQIARTPDPDSEFHFREILDFVEKLPESFRVPLKMYFEGYKYKEIADHLNLPIGTVKSRIFLARRQLMALRDEKRLSSPSLHS